MADNKIKEILNQYGQGSTDELIKRMKEEDETTKRAADIMKELDKNEIIKENIAEISRQIKQQFKRYFSENSIYQPDADRYVRDADKYVKKDGKYVKKELIKISGQVAKKIMEDITKESESEIDNGER